MPGQIQSSDDLRVFFVTHLHRGDDEASVYDKLAEARRSFVTVPSMHKEQPSNVTKLRSMASAFVRKHYLSCESCLVYYLCDGEVGGKACLFSFLANYANAIM